MSSELRRRIESRRRIYLMRHGDVSYFDGSGKPRHPDSVPLNEEGIAQARSAREALQRVPIDRAVHSGVPRTRQTVEIIVEGRGIPVESCEAFREVAPGPMEAGVSFEERFVGALKSCISRDSRFLGGESFGSLEDRVLPAFRSFLSSPKWKHLLIVAHGGTNRVILLHALGASLERLGCLEQEACCINVIDVDETQDIKTQDIIVRQVNFTPYSPLKENIWSTTMEKIYLDHHIAVESRLAALRARDEG